MNIKNNRRGIILAAGLGSRLYPITLGISKQLMPIYNKPMIYYPLTILMLAGIKEFLIISNPSDLTSFKRLLGDGKSLGISIKYEVQHSPDGIAQAFLIASNFLGDSNSALALGDNLFHGQALVPMLKAANNRLDGATIFTYPVKDPERYGVVNFNKKGLAESLEEKPINPKSKYAVTGLYFFDNTVVEKVSKLKPSKRGELEITDLNKMYLEENNLTVELMGRGTAWLDTGTFESMHEAGSYIRTLENKQGLLIGSPDEVAWRLNWIDDDQLEKNAIKFMKSDYGKYLYNLLRN